MLLSGGPFAVRETVTVRTVGQRVNECDKVGELLLRKTLRAEEKLLGARTALSGHIRIAPVPLKWLGSSKIFEGTVVDDVFAETVGLQIPLQAVDGGVYVAVRAAELALEGEISRVEQPLTAAKSIDTSRSTKINGGSRLCRIWCRLPRLYRRDDSRRRADCRLEKAPLRADCVRPECEM